MKISLRFKRHYPIILLLIFVLAFFTFAMGSQRIVAYTVRAGNGLSRMGVDYTNDVALFDGTIVHSIQILIADDDYQQMITTYKETGEKDYFHADVIIDGVQVSDVGVRLKGNASLMSALGRGGGMGMGWMGQRPGGGDNRPEFDPQNMPDMSEMPEPPAGGQWPGFSDGEMPAPEDFPFRPADGQMPAGVPGGQPFGNMTFGQGDNASKLPFMIKFDEFVSGQTYQGYTNLAIRTYGASPDAAMLQEPITNYAFRLLGLPATQTAYIGLQINDDAEQLYTISEVINENYLAEHFPNSNGVLYKAELGSSLSYLGEEPSAYANSFSQQTRVNDADLAPLIAFMRFLSESDDVTFERELSQYLDVNSFATYLAINNLLVNTDSIAGMNNNYYLYYDNTSQRFTLLMWDGNESLGKLAFGAQAAEYDLYYQNQQGMMRGPGRGENALVARFLENATFRALYEEKLRQVYRQVFLSAAMTQQVEIYAHLIRQTEQQRNLVVLDEYEAAVTSVLNFIAQRSDYLSTTPLLGEE